MECLLMVRETGVQSQVEAYQRLQKMLLDVNLLNIQHYKARVYGKVEQSREWSCALGLVAIEEKEPSDHPRLRSPTLLTLYLIAYVYIYIYIYIYMHKNMYIYMNTYIYKYNG